MELPSYTVDLFTVKSGSYQQLKLGIASETLFGNSSPNTEIRAD